MLGLPVGEDELEHGRRSIRKLGADRIPRSALRVLLSQSQPPLFDAIGDEIGDALEPDAVRQTRVGHRYAFGCLFASEGSFARMFCR